MNRVERMIRDPDTCPNCWGLGYLPASNYKKPFISGSTSATRMCHVCKGTGKSITYMKAQLKKAGIEGYALWNIGEF